MVRTSRPQQPGRVHRNDTHSGAVDRAPPGQQAPRRPASAGAASGAVELPFSRREEIARRFGTEGALREAERVLETGGADTLDWSDSHAWEVLADLHRLNSIFQMDPAARRGDGRRRLERD